MTENNWKSRLAELPESHRRRIFLLESLHLAGILAFLAHLLFIGGTPSKVHYECADLRGYVLAYLVALPVFAVAVWLGTVVPRSRPTPGLLPAAWHVVGSVLLVGVVLLDVSLMVGAWGRCETKCAIVVETLSGGAEAREHDAHAAQQLRIDAVHDAPRDSALARALVAAVAEKVHLALAVDHAPEQLENVTGRACGKLLPSDVVERAHTEPDKAEGLEERVAQACYAAPLSWRQCDALYRFCAQGACAGQVPEAAARLVREACGNVRAAELDTSLPARVAAVSFLESGKLCGADAEAEARRTQRLTDLRQRNENLRKQLQVCWEKLLQKTPGAAKPPSLEELTGRCSGLRLKTTHCLATQALSRWSDATRPTFEQTSSDPAFRKCDEEGDS